MGLIFFAQSESLIYITYRDIDRSLITRIFGIHHVQQVLTCAGKFIPIISCRIDNLPAKKQSTGKMLRIATNNFSRWTFQ